MCLESCLIKVPNLKDNPIYIDGSNIAYSRYNQHKKPILSDILIVYDYLRNTLEFKKENIHCICDPALKYYIDKPIEYQVLIKEGVIIEAPKVAGEFILSFAIKHDFCFIISNDRFRNYIEQLPSKQWLEERRISFMIIDDNVCLSPNINFERLQAFNDNNLRRELPKLEITTLDILNSIDKSEGELNLF